MLLSEPVQPVAPSTEACHTDRLANDVARRILEMVEDGRAAEMDAATVQNLMHALVLLYGARFKAELRDTPFVGGRHIEATPVLVTASALLKAANLELFELGMWQSWSGTR